SRLATPRRRPSLPTRRSSDLDVAQQAVQRRALHAAARVAAVVVTIRQRHPAFGLLAGDECLRRLALGVERVELLIEPFVAGLAGDRKSTRLNSSHVKISYAVF